MNSMIKLATPHQIECEELAALNARITVRRLRQQLAEAEQLAVEAEEQRRAEKAKHEKEMKIILCGLPVLACLATAITCFVAAPWWTAVSPMVFAAYILRKAGW